MENAAGELPDRWNQRRENRLGVQARQQKENVMRDEIAELIEKVAKLRTLGESR